jgi:uncharacterized membrane protein
MLNALSIILHLLAINVWVGGTFFTVVILPHAAASLEPAERHPFMRIVFKRFFFWVWLAMMILISTGGWMIYRMFGGIINAPLYVVLMMSITLLMVCVFLLIYFGSYRLYVQSLKQENLSDSERHLDYISLLSKINMALGICVVLVIGGGPHFLL